MLSLRDKYIKTIADKVCISVEDLTASEIEIINATFDVFQDRLEDIKTLTEDNKRLTITVANLKSYNDNNDYGEEAE